MLLGSWVRIHPELFPNVHFGKLINPLINGVIDSDVIMLRNLAKKTVKRVYFKISAASSSFIQSYWNFTETLTIHVVFD